MTGTENSLDRTAAAAAPPPRHSGAVPSARPPASAGPAGTSSGRKRRAGKIRCHTCCGYGTPCCIRHFREYGPDCGAGRLLCALSVSAPGAVSLWIDFGDSELGRGTWNRIEAARIEKGEPLRPQIEKRKKKRKRPPAPPGP